MCTVRRETAKAKNKIDINFYEPICYKNNAYEVFPNMNILKLDKQEYITQMYFCLAKGLARNQSKKINLKKEGFKVKFLNGINAYDIYIKNNEVTILNKIEYSDLNEILAYIVAQLLYENIERRPFLYELEPYQEIQLKQVKYYLNKCYFNIWHLVREYLNCDILKISSRFKKIGFDDLREVEEKIKRI